MLRKVLLLLLLLWLWLWLLLWLCLCLLHRRLHLTMQLPFRPRMDSPLQMTPQLRHSWLQLKPGIRTSFPAIYE